MPPLKVYLSARTRRQYQDRNNKLVDLLDPTFEIFLPQLAFPESGQNHIEIQPDVANGCEDAINKSDLGIVYYPIGKDCAYEVGMLHTLGKPVFLVMDTSEEWKNDWMIKNAVDGVIILKYNIDKLIENKFSGYSWLPLPFRKIIETALQPAYEKRIESIGISVKTDPILKYTHIDDFLSHFIRCFPGAEVMREELREHMPAPYTQLVNISSRNAQADFSGAVSYFYQLTKNSL